jgi:Matrixin
MSQPKIIAVLLEFTMRYKFVSTKKFSGYFASLIVASLVVGAILLPAVAQRHNAGRPAAAAAGNPYPEFRAGSNVIHWLPEQMPLRVYISPGLTLDSIIDPQLGAPYSNVDNRDHWPDLVASVVQNQEQMNGLQVAQGYAPEHYQAARQGIESWKNCGNGLFSLEFVQDPADADIYVFWTNHFVNKLGLGLFANDIRGYTAKRSFPLRAIKSAEESGVAPPLKPVVTFLRTTDGGGNPMPLGKMKASAAHEFGHALGIEGHSTNPSDLMSVYYGHGAVSPNDSATIRYLYSLTPSYVP